MDRITRLQGHVLDNPGLEGVFDIVMLIYLLPLSHCLSLLLCVCLCLHLSVCLFHQTGWGMLWNFAYLLLTHQMDSIGWTKPLCALCSFKNLLALLYLLYCKCSVYLLIRLVVCVSVCVLLIILLLVFIVNVLMLWNYPVIKIICLMLNDSHAKLTL